MKEQRSTRRRVLAVVATGGLAATAGCSTLATQDRSTTAAEPEVSADRLRGWDRVDEQTGLTAVIDLGPVSVRVQEYTVLWEDRETRQRLREETLGGFDETLRLFFASRLDLDPSIDQLPLGFVREAVLDRIERRAREDFRAEMERQGVENVQRDGGESLDVGRVRDARLTIFQGEKPIEATELPVAGGETLTVPDGSLAVSGLLAVWHDGTDALVSGGAFPGEEYREEVREDLTESISVTVEVDLGLEPERYHEELVELIRSVE